MSQLSWDNIEVGDDLPPITDAMNFTRVASAPAATLDWFPLHHDADYARAQGHPGAVLSTVQLMGLVDRVVTEWAGPATLIRRRETRLQHSVYPDDVLVCQGRVASKSEDGAGPGRVATISVEITNGQRVLCCSATVSVAIPS